MVIEKTSTFGSGLSDLDQTYPVEQYNYLLSRLYEENAKGIIGLDRHCHKSIHVKKDKV